MFILVKTYYRDHLVNVANVVDITTCKGLMNDHKLVFRQCKEELGKESLQLYFHTKEDAKAAFAEVQKQLLGKALSVTVTDKP